MKNNKYDWLGLCLEMMSEYFPIEVRSKPEADRYWNINPHLLSVMNFSELSRHHDDNEELNGRNDLLKDMIRLFTATNMSLTDSPERYNEADGVSDNVAINNLLLLSLLD